MGFFTASLSTRLERKPEPRRYGSFAHGPDDELIYCPPCTPEEGKAAWDKLIREENEREA